MMSAVGLLLLMLASHQSQAAVDDGTKQQQYFSRYNNVFFSDPPHMKGRPSTSFVRVSFTNFAGNDRFQHQLLQLPLT